MDTSFFRHYEGLFRVSTSIPLQFQEGHRKVYPTILLDDKNNDPTQFPQNSLYTTKYTLWSFIPKLLYEQFRKATSFYFLIVAIIASIPDVSPFNPVTSWFGLIFILLVSAIREGYEDYHRFQVDMRVNNTIFTTIERQTGTQLPTPSYAISVGDVVFLNSEERVPVDMVLLKSSNDDGTCFIETAQLDGETNLKLRKVANENIQKMNTTQEVASVQGTLVAETPNHNLYQFKGSLTVGGERFSLSTDNLLLCSSFLKNTEWVIGLCVYVGPETKLGLNLKLPPSKFSRLDRKLNYYIFFVFFFKIVLVIMATLMNVSFRKTPVAKYLHLNDENVSIAIEGVKVFIMYFALLSYLIPLCLVVTLDIVRFVQALLIGWDQDLMEEQEHSTAKTSNLNDELALVDYIFSDKTGTITENRMFFNKASINGSVYEGKAGNSSIKSLLDNPIDKNSAKVVSQFLYALALAHSCHVENVCGTYQFTSASPDEEALCKAAAENGFVFAGREGKWMNLEVRGRKEKFELLAELKFSSERRRMSVIVRTPEGRIKMYTKGADSAVIEALSENKNEKLNETTKDLHHFSLQGLRTLMIASKNLSEKQFDQFWENYNNATNLIEGRDKELENVYSGIETDLRLLGATGIEDSLQQYVPETIDNLRRAGIKIWIITGDKQETAINIGFSSHLLSSEMDIVQLNATNPEDTYILLQNNIKTYCKSEDKPFSVVCDGGTLAYILTDFRQMFLTLTARCDAVICNRVTPLQKAEIVNMIQTGLDCVCLSVGDGGNDVSMIQQAKIGVGIKGREGLQAARAADFAIPQFYCLQKLLLVHGRYSLLRNTKVIYGSFYKNIVVFITIVWYSFFNGASGLLYGHWIMILYNIVFTSLPLLAVGIFEKDLHEWIVYRNPEIYREQKKLTFKSLALWLANGLFHSLFIFLSVFAVFHLGNGGGDVLPNGGSTDLNYFASFLITIAFHLVLAKLLLETNHWVVWTVVAQVLSVIGYYVFEICESKMIGDQQNVFETVVKTPNLWVGIILGIVGCLMIDVSLKFIHRQYFPKPWYILQEKYSQQELHNIPKITNDTRTKPFLTIDEVL